MLKDKEAILFDLDGTLVDSMWMWEEIDIEFLARFGLACPDHLQKTIEGMGFSETAIYFKEYFALPLSIAEIKQSWIKMALDQYRYHVPLKTGVLEFLSYLKKNKIKAAIATSNGIEMVEAVLDSLKIKSYFQAVVTACEVAAGKPSPDIYLEAARRVGTEPVNCLVFEDIPAGILAAKRANMCVCAVEDDFSKEMRQEKQAMADFYISDYFELLHSLENGE